MRAGPCLQITMHKPGIGTHALNCEVSHVGVSSGHEFEIRVCCGKNDLFPPHGLSNPDLKYCRYVLALAFEVESIFRDRDLVDQMKAEVEAVLYRDLLEGILLVILACGLVGAIGQSPAPTKDRRSAPDPLFFISQASQTSFRRSKLSRDFTATRHLNKDGHGHAQSRSAQARLLETITLA